MEDEGGGRCNGQGVTTALRDEGVGGGGDVPVHLAVSFMPPTQKYVAGQNVPFAIFVPSGQ